MISINENQFLTSIENNLQSRLLIDNDGENKIILKNIVILEKLT